MKQGVQGLWGPHGRFKGALHRGLEGRAVRDQLLFTPGWWGQRADRSPAPATPPPATAATPSLGPQLWKQVPGSEGCPEVPGVPGRRGEAPRPPWLRASTFFHDTSQPSSPTPLSSPPSDAGSGAAPARPGLRCGAHRTRACRGLPAQPRQVSLAAEGSGSGACGLVPVLAHHSRGPETSSPASRGLGCLACGTRVNDHGTLAPGGTWQHVPTLHKVCSEGAGCVGSWNRKRVCLGFFGYK